MSTDILKQLQREAENPAERIRSKERLDRDIRYLVLNMDHWRAEHPNRWIAVYDEELVAVEDTQERLLAALKTKDVPLSEVLVDFVSEQPMKFLL